MGIKDTLKGIGKRGKFHERCERNPDTGEVVCKKQEFMEMGLKQMSQDLLQGLMLLAM